MLPFYGVQMAILSGPSLPRTPMNTTRNTATLFGAGRIAHHSKRDTPPMARFEAQYKQVTTSDAARKELLHMREYLCSVDRGVSASAREKRGAPATQLRGGSLERGNVLMRKARSYRNVGFIPLKTRMNQDSANVLHRA